MISTVPPANPGSSSVLRANLRAQYLRTNDAAALRALDEVERREALLGGSFVHVAARAAPFAVAGLAACFSFALSPEPVADLEHTARVLGVISAPLLTKILALRFLA